MNIRAFWSDLLSSNRLQLHLHSKCSARQCVNRIVKEFRLTESKTFYFPVFSNNSELGVRVATSEKMLSVVLLDKEDLPILYINGRIRSDRFGTTVKLTARKGVGYRIALLVWIFIIAIIYSILFWEGYTGTSWMRRLLPLFLIFCLRLSRKYVESLCGQKMREDEVDAVIGVIQRIQQILEATITFSSVPLIRGKTKIEVKN